jgi:hypothetical protein
VQHERNESLQADNSYFDFSQEGLYNCGDFRVKTTAMQYKPHEQERI